MFFPLEKAYRSPCRQLTGLLTGSLTGALTGHELMGTDLWQPHKMRNGPNTLSESTVSNTELREFGRVPGRELSELLSACYWSASANSSSLKFSQNSPSLVRHRRGAILLHVCFSPGPFSCGKMSLFYLKTCTPVKATP